MLDRCHVIISLTSILSRNREGDATGAAIIGREHPAQHLPVAEPTPKFFMGVVNCPGKIFRLTAEISEFANGRERVGRLGDCLGANTRTRPRRWRRRTSCSAISSPL